MNQTTAQVKNSKMIVSCLKAAKEIPIVLIRDTIAMDSYFQKKVGKKNVRKATKIMMKISPGKFSEFFLLEMKAKSKILEQKQHNKMKIQK